MLRTFSKMETRSSPCLACLRQNVERSMKKMSKVLDLRPTQFAVGMLEVDEKIALVKTYNSKQLKQYVKENPVPVVRAPNGELYIVDHHHFLAVCYHLGIRKVRVEIVEDLKGSKVTYRKFWDRLIRRGQTYLNCQFGNGPHREFYLPKDIRGLADDPYRSMAWFVRKGGAFNKSDRNFAEFQWANFFREKRLLNRLGMAGFPLALEKAVELSQSPEAKNLPGFGKLNLVKQAEAKSRIIKKVKKYKHRFKARAIVAEVKPKKNLRKAKA